MTYPDDLTTVTVRHTVADTSGRPSVGPVLVTLTDRLWTDTGTIVPTKYVGEDLGDGVHEFVVPALDQDGITPQGAALRITEQVPGTPRPFYILPLVEHAAAEHVWARDIMSPPPKPGGGIVTVAGPATDASMAEVAGDPDSAFTTSLKSTFVASDELLDVSTNLYDTRTVLMDHILAFQSGTPTSNTDYSVSDWIVVDPAKQYTYNDQILRISYFDAAGTFLTSPTLPVGQGEPTIEAPRDGATRVRLSVQKSRMAAAQMNEGATVLPYEPGGSSVRGEYLPDPTPLVEQIAAQKVAAEFPLPPAKTTFFEKSANLFDRATVTRGKIYNFGESAPVDNPAYSISDWIPVTPGAVYTLAGDPRRISYFDADRNYVTNKSVAVPQAAPEVLPAVPATARWARLSIANEFVETAQMNAGTEALPYEPGGTRIPARYLTLPDAPAGGGAGPLAVLDSDVSAPYDGAATHLPTFPADVLYGTTAQGMYDLYDQLATDHPGYVTRTLLGNEGSTDALPIYQYDFTPPTPPDNGPTPGPPALPTVLVFAGTHGSERASIWAAYWLMRAICEHWQDDPLLEVLRHEVRFVVVPVVNPWGTTNLNRDNHNGVNLNRNFPTGWAPTTPGAQDYGGTAPLSEPEAQAVDAVMRDNPQALAAIDFHNYFTPTDPNHLIWVLSGMANVITLGSALIRRMTRLWRPRPYVSDDPAQFAGYVTTRALGGTIGEHGATLGFPVALTFEVSGRVNGGELYDADSLTAGYEAWVNFVLMVLDKYAR